MPVKPSNTDVSAFLIQRLDPIKGGPIEGESGRRAGRTLVKLAYHALHNYYLIRSPIQGGGRFQGGRVWLITAVCRLETGPPPYGVRPA